MTYREIYESWLTNEDFDASFIDELKGLTDEREIEDRFYKDLSFGTAGMRGVIGAGRNRINKYNIRKATQGYANYLLQKNSEATCVIAYDNRRMSIAFSQEAACVFAANGIKTYLFDALRSTPELSFAIRHFNATGGVVITASHNPPEYNGYKVYGEDGAQLMPTEADKVTSSVKAVTDFSNIPSIQFEEGIRQGKIILIGEEVDKIYLTAVKRQIIRESAYKEPMTITFSPLHGTGGMIIEKLLKELDVDDVVCVPTQMIVDTEFSTVKKPNPEELQAFDVSKTFGESIGAELLIATDPDADRVGVVVRDQSGDYIALNGNQVGALLTYYILSSKHEMPLDAILIKTVVTSDLGIEIAKDFGVGYEETLTGFKFIGNKIKQYEAEKSQSFILGYEESYGYLIGTHARDKDAVVTTMMIIEMAKYYKSIGKDLLCVLDQIHEKYGYYQDKLIAKVLEGKEGMAQIEKIIEGFRQEATSYFKSLNLICKDDFERGVKTDLKVDKSTPLDYPKSNVLKYYLENGSWFAIRPSGTEPKIKFYCSVKSQSKEGAQAQATLLENHIQDFVAYLIKK